MKLSIKTPDSTELDYFNINNIFLSNSVIHAILVEYFKCDLF